MLEARDRVGGRVHSRRLAERRRRSSWAPTSSRPTTTCCAATPALRPRRSCRAACGTPSASRAASRRRPRRSPRWRSWRAPCCCAVSAGRRCRSRALLDSLDVDPDAPRGGACRASRCRRHTAPTASTPACSATSGRATAGRSRTGSWRATTRIARGLRREPRRPHPPVDAGRVDRPGTRTGVRVPTARGEFDRRLRASSRVPAAVLKTLPFEPALPADKRAALGAAADRDGGEAVRSADRAPTRAVGDAVGAGALLGVDGARRRRRGDARS